MHIKNCLKMQNDEEFCLFVKLACELQNNFTMGWS